ncbi:GTR1-like protein, partial [Mya arenaria]
VTLQLCVAVLSAIMGSFQFGYNTGVINAPETQIKSFLNMTHYNRTGSAMKDVTITSLYALIVSIFAVGGVVGGLAAGWWADFFGRKFGMILNNIIGIAACVMMYLSRTAMSYEMVIVGRLLVGICCGLFTGLTPMYLSEISTPSTRGALGVLHQLGTVTGLLASQILGFPEILGNKHYWNLLLGLGVSPCILQLLSMPLCPESPRFLLITKGREHQARKALQSLRGIPDVSSEIEEMKSECAAGTKEDKVSIFGLFRKRSLRMPLVISIVMQLSQQFSGINAIFYYSFTLFKQAGLAETTSAHATSGVGATMILMTLITVPLMDRVGRRSLHLLGLGGMFIFSVLITLCLSLTVGSIPWLIVSELFPQGPRPAAMSVSVLVNWVANFTSGLGDFSFLPFTVLLGLFFLFTLKFVPETKNKTIEEITQNWRTDKRQDAVFEQHVSTADEKNRL